MVHSLVILLFYGTIITILYGYGYIQYAFFLFVFFLPLLSYKLVFHRLKVISVAISFLLLVCCAFYLSSKIEELNYRYESGFNISTKETVYAGTISSFPSYRFSNNQYILDIKDTESKVLVIAEPYRKFDFNDELSIKGKMNDIRDQDVQWHMYYKKLGVHYIIFNPEISKIEKYEEDSIFDLIMRKLFDFKMKIRSDVIDMFSFHSSALVLGMLLGEKDELSKLEKEMFNTVGLSHILVVSGYNISLLIAFMFAISKPFSRWIKIAFSLVMIVLFVLLVGAEGSVVRAALMGGIIIFSKVANRPSSAVNILHLVVILMLMHNPFSIFDAGLHLSFIATYSLLILPRLRIPEFVLASVWVFMFVSPYVVYMSDQVSFVSVAANIAVVLVLPIFLLFSVVSLVISNAHVFLGFDVFVIETLSRYIFFVARTIQGAPVLKINIAPHIVVVLYFIFFSCMIFVKNRYTTEEFIQTHYQKSVQQLTN